MEHHTKPNECPSMCGPLAARLLIALAVAASFGLLLHGGLPMAVAAGFPASAATQNADAMVVQSSPAPADYTAIHSPLGYQVMAPADWQQLSLSGGDMLFRSPDRLVLMDIVATSAPTDLDGIDMVAADVIRDYRNGVQSPDFAVIETAANTSVANADAATLVHTEYTSRTGVIRTALFLVSLRETMLYILVLDQPRDYVNDHAGQSMHIVQSFMLTAP